ncbi:Hypothetical protein NGAL_HAMBI2566_31920 [Neorhizobium galegae bv. orientalis]|nr:Hypothetical protein NGAL_HAMBI2566_31920 [Neorhizobium galegae bv. orientalis]
MSLECMLFDRLKQGIKLITLKAGGPSSRVSQVAVYYGARTL